uniref:Uncharacterized protein n=1 Tax=Fervidicoccus fontis TaxID=683846 RepID=A0A7J3SLA3_9CREN
MEVEEFPESEPEFEEFESSIFEFDWKKWKKAGWKNEDIAREWSEKDWFPYSAKKWYSAGWREPEIARAWYHIWYLIGPLEAFKWYSAGWRNPFHAKYWFEHGWNDPVEAYKWYNSGWRLYAEEALEALERGLEPYEALVLPEYEDVAWVKLVMEATKLIKRAAKTLNRNLGGKTVRENIRRTARLLREAAEELEASRQTIAFNEARIEEIRNLIKRMWQKFLENKDKFPKEVWSGLWNWSRVDNLLKPLARELGAAQILLEPTIDWIPEPDIEFRHKLLKTSEKDWVYDDVPEKELMGYLVEIYHADGDYTLKFEKI